MNSAELCQKNGWTVGTRLMGDEGYGSTCIILITAVGEENILARVVSRNGIPWRDCESNWTLECRDWHVYQEGKP